MVMEVMAAVAMARVAAREKAMASAAAEAQAQLEALQGDTSNQLASLEAQLEQSKTDASSLAASLREQLAEALASRDKSEAEAMSGMREALGQKEAALQELQGAIKKQADAQEEAMAQVQASKRDLEVKWSQDLQVVREEAEREAQEAAERHGLQLKVTLMSATTLIHTVKHDSLSRNMTFCCMCGVHRRWKPSWRSLNQVQKRLTQQRSLLHNSTRRSLLLNTPQ